MADCVLHHVRRNFFFQKRIFDDVGSSLSSQPCDFCTANDALQLFVSRSNQQDSSFCRINNLDGAVFGNSLSGLLQNKPRLQ
jgi:hypothetical protein